MSLQSVEASANGRVNLIGEHTDYNGGWVLPTAIPQSTTVHLQRREDRWVIASTSWAAQITGDPKQEHQRHVDPSELRYELGAETPQKNWIDYVQGATQILAKEGFKLSGFDLQIESTVPTGSGLSSSAALEISLLKALRELFALDLTDEKMALIGQRIENDFVGAKVGIMDQMACALANFGEALFLDTKTLKFERVKLPFDQIDLLVINSGVEHQHSNGDYNQRRAECEKACAALGIKELRELEEKDLPKLEVLQDVLKRRARHVITENARVHAAVKAIVAKDFKKLGDLFAASHASMRDDYEVSIDAIDQLVEITRTQPGVFGARLTGGGFGGSIVAMTEKGKAAAIGAKVRKLYAVATPNQASVLVP